jgi:drug/metabolite transporter (DMT)-like permease
MSVAPSAGGRAGPFTAFILCALIWGSTFLAISIGNDTVPPVWAAALRLLIAAVVLFVVSFVTRQALPQGAGLSAAIGYGIFQFGGNLPLLYWGETAVPSGLSAVIFATIPITTMFMAQAFRLEKLTRGKIVAALIALVGVVIIFSSERMGRVSLLPAFAILLATWVATLGTMILKRGPRQSAIGVNAVACAAGFVVCVIISFIVREHHTIPSSWAAIYPIVYLAIAGSVGAFVIFSWLVQRWPVTRTSYIAVVIPIIAVILGTIVRHERLHPVSVLGSAVVLLGVILGLRASVVKS